MRRITCLALFLLLLAAGCGEVPTPQPGWETAPAEPPTETLPPIPTPPETAPAERPPTRIPYPMPTPAPVTPMQRPTATAGPTPIVLGEEWAPEAERQTYVSTTVVLAPVGDGPGEVGFSWRHYPDGLPIHADQFTVDARGNIYILDVVNQRVAKFDPQGKFVANVVYGDAVQFAANLAADAEGRIYIYELVNYAPTLEEIVNKVKLFDSEGELLWETPVPSWFIDRLIMAMRVDEQGTLWVQGEGYSPNSPVIDVQPYSRVSIPLGNAAGPFDLDEDEQQAQAVPGHLLPSGKSMIVYYLPKTAYVVYDSSGQPIYQVPEGIIAIDLAGYMYCCKETDEGYTTIKWDTLGRQIASFDLPFGWIRIEGDGTVYCFFIDRETWDTYYVIRAWQE